MPEVSHNELNRALGRLEGKLEQVLESRKQRDENVDDRLARIEAKIEAIGETLSNAKGGWRVLTLIGGGAGLVGGWVIPGLIKKLMGW